jgi:CHRD domain/IPTL-CTERM motif
MIQSKMGHALNSALLALFLCIGAAAAQTPLNAALTGTNELVDGDPDGTGRAVVVVDATTGRVWWNITAFNILPTTAAHIHRGIAGVDGDVVFDFSARHVGVGTMSSALASEILGNPAGFYVNIYTSAHPSGAIRGQLSDLALPARATFNSALLGSNEVANGAVGASGAAYITIDPVTGVAYWRISTAGVGTPTGAHIHRAAAGANGPVVFDFSAELTGSGVMSLALVAEILANPTGFYFNVHTATNPSGAIRGQLFPADVIAVPTLSEWSLLVLAFAVALLALRRRRQT